jgi:minor extracellular serine protease Vpr
MLRPYLALLLLLPALAFGQQQLYIVELGGMPPALDQLKAGTHRTAKREFAAAQTRVRESQRVAMRAVESIGGRVAHQLDTIANALIVEVSDARTAAALARIPGVKRVEPVIEGHAVMDRALGIHNVPQVWDTLPGGSDNAGAGMRIAIVDTGVDIRHPGLLDETLPTPEGYPKFGSVNEAIDSVALSGFNNKKVLVLRSYENLVDRSVTSSSARDNNGHGTGVAFAALGKKVDGPAGPISGVAPKAYLGVYRITTAGAGSSNTAATFSALDDAVKDGMDVINLSFGFQPVFDDFNEDVARRIYDAGVIFVSAAGNNGSGLQSIAWPGSSPWVVGVGSSSNDRTVTRATVVTSTGAEAIGYNGAASRARGKFTGSFKDSAAFAGNQLACDPFPADSLKDSIVLILRGTCTFEVKLNNASRAGALAAVIYNPVQLDQLFFMGQGDNTTPATWVDNDKGLLLKKAIADNPNLTVTVNFSIPIPADDLSDFSSRGPTTGRLNIKPDVVAVGESFITATPTTCCLEDAIIAPGLTLTQGTSLSSPVVAGAAAILKQSRPGLKVQEYRSLLVNSARALTLTAEKSRTAIPHEVGAGRLDLVRANTAMVTAEPLSISFGGGGKNPPATRRTLKFTNIGMEQDTFAISVEPLGDSQAAAVSASSLTLASKATGEVEVTMPGSDLRAGHHHGILIVKGTKSDVEIRVPYWYGVASNEPGSVAIISDPPPQVSVGGQATFVFRVTDTSGQALDSASPTIEAVTPGGTPDTVQPDNRGNGLFRGAVRVGRTAGTLYEFRVKAGDAVQSIFVATP